MCMYVCVCMYCCCCCVVVLCLFNVGTDPPPPTLIYILLSSKYILWIMKNSNAQNANTNGYPDDQPHQPYAPGAKATNGETKMTKTNTNISLDAEVLEACRAKNYNVSGACNEALRDLLSKDGIILENDIQQQVAKIRVDSLRKELKLVEDSLRVIDQVKEDVVKQVEVETKVKEDGFSEAVRLEKQVIQDRIDRSLSDPGLYGGPEKGIGVRLEVLESKFGLDVTEEVYLGWIDEVRNNGVNDGN